jgi:hypothetical protein
MAAEIITKSDLDLFENRLIHKITTLLNARHTSDKPEFLRSADVCKMLQISTGTLQTLRITGKLPFKKLNGTLYYPYKGILAALESGD